MPSAAQQLEAEAEAGAGANNTTTATVPSIPEKADNAASTPASASSDTVVPPEMQEKTPEEHRSAGKTFLLMFPLSVSRCYAVNKYAILRDANYDL